MASNPHLCASSASLTFGEIPTIHGLSTLNRTDAWSRVKSRPEICLVSGLAEVFIQFRQVEIHRRGSPVSSSAPGVPADAVAMPRQGSEVLWMAGWAESFSDGFARRVEHKPSQVAVWNVSSKLRFSIHTELCWTGWFHEICSLGTCILHQ